jgi:thiol-disulfide isomerase/thioredoxin
MKSAVLIFLSVTMLALTSVSAQGIDFQSDTLRWQAILDKAKASNKIVFVDAYTTWCGPCKRMAKDVFPLKAVGDVYNAAFVNVKMDMEKGEGPSVGKRYGVKAYPTYLFVDGDGNLVHRGLGMIPTEKFIALAKAATNPETQFFGLKRKYDGGERSADFLKKFVVACGEANEEALAEEVVEAYLKTQKDLSKPENVRFIYQFSKKIDSDGVQYWLKNRSFFVKELGSLHEEGVLENILVTAIGKPHFNPLKKEVDLVKAREFAVQKLPSDIAERIVSLLTLQNAEMKGDVPTILTEANRHLTTFPSINPNQLNDFAWFFYENATEKPQLEKALTWALKAVGLDDAYAYNDTTAALYFKLGNKAQAKIFAEKAIKLGKEHSENVGETENLLKKIEAM